MILLFTIGVDINVAGHFYLLVPPEADTIVLIWYASMIMRL